MREGDSLVIRRWERNAFVTSFDRDQVHALEIAFDECAPERFVENGKMGISYENRDPAVVPTYAEALALGGQESGTVVPEMVLEYDYAIGSVAVESEAAAPLTMTAKAVGCPHVVGHLKSNQLEGQRAVASVVRGYVDVDAVPALLAVELGVTVAVTLKGQQHERIRIWG